MSIIFSAKDGLKQEGSAYHVRIWRINRHRWLDLHPLRGPAPAVLPCKSTLQTKILNICQQVILWLTEECATNSNVTTFKMSFKTRMMTSLTAVALFSTIVIAFVLAARLVGSLALASPAPRASDPYEMTRSWSSLVCILMSRISFEDWVRIFTCPCVLHIYYSNKLLWLLFKR